MSFWSTGLYERNFKRIFGKAENNPRTRVWYVSWNDKKKNTIVNSEVNDNKYWLNDALVIFSNLKWINMDELTQSRT